MNVNKDLVQCLVDPDRAEAVPERGIRGPHGQHAHDQPRPHAGKQLRQHDAPDRDAKLLNGQVREIFVDPGRQRRAEAVQPRHVRPHGRDIALRILLQLDELVIGDLLRRERVLHGVVDGRRGLIIQLQRRQLRQHGRIVKPRQQHKDRDRRQQHGKRRAQAVPLHKCHSAHHPLQLMRGAGVVCL